MFKCQIKRNKCQKRVKNIINVLWKIRLMWPSLLLAYEWNINSNLSFYQLIFILKLLNIPRKPMNRNVEFNDVYNKPILRFTFCFRYQFKMTSISLLLTRLNCCSMAVVRFSRVCLQKKSLHHQFKEEKCYLKKGK